MKYKNFSEIFKIKGGGQPPKSVFIYQPQEGYIRLLQIRDFGKKPHPTYIPEDQAKQKCESDDIMIARYGASLGRIMTGMEGAYNVAMAKVVFDRTCLIPKRVYYYLQTRYFQTPIHMISRSAQNGFNKGDLKQIQVPLFPTKTQQRIVSEIEKQFARIDAGIESLQIVEKKLKEYKASVLKSAVEGNLTADRREKNPDIQSAGELLEEMLVARRKKRKEDRIEEFKSKGKRPQKNDKWMEKYLDRNDSMFSDSIEEIMHDIPHSWERSMTNFACTKVIDCHNKTAPYTDDGIMLIRTTNVRDGKINLDGCKYVNEETYLYWSRRCIPEPGDIIFTREAPMGESGIIADGVKLCMGQRMMLLRANNTCLVNKYLHILLLSPFLDKYVRAKAIGSGVQHLRVKYVEEIPIPIPPMKEQFKIIEEVEQRISITDYLLRDIKNQLSNATNLKQSILQKVFSGELVQQLPEDGDVEELLEQIKIAKSEYEAEMKEKKKRKKK